MLPFILMEREGKTEKWRLIQDCTTRKQERERKREKDKEREREKGGKRKKKKH